MSIGKAKKRAVFRKAGKRKGGIVFQALSVIIKALWKLKRQKRQK